MPSVTIVEMLSSTMPTGDHVWIEIEFGHGKKVTLRLDEHDNIDPSKTSIYIAVNDQVGQDVKV